MLLFAFYIYFLVKRMFKTFTQFLFGCLFSNCQVWRVLSIFWSQVFFCIWDLQMFSPSLYIVFSFSYEWLFQSKSFKWNKIHFIIFLWNVLLASWLRNFAYLNVMKIFSLAPLSNNLLLHFLPILNAEWCPRYYFPNHWLSLLLCLGYSSHISCI